ncbi:NlpC/P60 family protein [Modestobacter sp. I12A-02628]|uniref:C40 family peptidase n=1 Tax=Goekera deserti TaxID=2497753 RepID=A0A7K3WCH5_9ACTN|nr:C40 family peptidase [Goekera deserti]MPQ98917.1 NlpC/P60 family protein [Goekera deserti]NDI49584.1 NlpC/P60 family protein [Goekera deserti]NEL53223.1 C40 family peptidase [Goekera deserti]
MDRNRTTARSWARSAALALTVGIAVTVCAPTASATPAAPAAPAPAAPAPAAEPSTAAEAATLVARSGQQLEALAEQVNEARELAGQQLAAAEVAAGQAATAQAAVDAFAPQLRAIAQHGYAGNHRSRLEVLLTSSSADDLVQQLGMLDVLAAETDDMITQVAAARRTALDAQAAADAAAAAAQGTVATLEGQQRDLQAQQDGYEADFARLTAAQRERVTTVLAGPTLAAPTAAAVTASAAAAPTEAAGVAVQTALAQVGDPYVVGAVGPNGFDCSGLTMFAYAAAGVSLPHSSRSQSQMGTPVSRADLQPGDLVFFYSPVSHVGMYIGNGQMVHSSVTGRPVAVTSVDKSGYVGARRVTA